MSVDASATLRLLVPALVGWVAWVVYRAPYQERPNRLLSAFLVLIAVGFLLEFLWLAFKGSPSATAFRWAQLVLGFADPPLLLAYALTFPRPPARWSPRLFAAAAALAVAALSAALALGHDGDLNFTWPWASAASLAYVSGAYLAAFFVLLRRTLSEPRRFLARQLLFVALATGFVALSRIPAFFLPGGVGLLVPGSGSTLHAVGYGTLPVLAAFAAICVLAWAWGRRGLRSPLPLLASLGLLLAVFLGAWALLAAPATSAGLFFFGLRWVFFALIVGHGILRHQLFDFQAETWNGLSYLAAVAAGVLATLHVGQATPAGPAALALTVSAGAAAMGAAYLGLRQFGRLLRRGADPASPRRLLLEIYEATLEYALDPPAQEAGPQQRLVETLRELFEVSPQEHERIMARLRGAAA